MSPGNAVGIEPGDVTGNASISFQNIVKRFSRDGVPFIALNGVSFDVQDGEFISILGPSGCGKTTLIRIAAGLIRADGGDIVIDGSAKPVAGKDSCLVFQNFGLLPWRTVRKNVEFGLELEGMGRAERASTAQHFIDLVGLDGFEESYPHQISGGMQQRVGIARALAKNPKILLMDEPFGAVDAQTRELLQVELLRIWRETRKTILFVTHSIDEAIFLSDRIIVMQPNPGRIQNIIDVGLQRPRDGINIHADKRFVELGLTIREMLRDGFH